VRLDFDRLARRDRICDAFGKAGWEEASRPPDGGGVWVEGQNGGRFGGDTERESTIPAAEFEHALITEVAKPSQGGEVSAFGIKHVRHRLHVHRGLYALTVVPRAPNFCALRRVSSNFERA
jgi:hypothetical protein